ncbi:hypothetical protein SUGI_0718390 [Cryptomeria japonica]|nr:hypothetical protein SUGI_0718390 [Cryptomeria japonica]
MLLRGQKFKVGQKLTANISPTNTSQGVVYATLLVNGFALYTAPAPPQMYFRYPSPPTTYNVAYIQFDNASVGFYPEGFPFNPVPQSLPIPHNSLYLQIQSNGHVFFFSFEQETKKSVHDYLQASQLRWIDTSKPDPGCVPRSPVSCPEKRTMNSTKGYELLELDNVSYFSYDWGNVSLPRLVSREECKALCFKNCSCKAAFFRYDMSENYSSGSCYLESNVYSLKMNSLSDGFYNSAAYIKVQRKPKNTKRSVIGISISVVSGTVVVFLVLWVWIARSRKSKQRQRRDESDDDDVGDPLNLRTRLPLRFSFQEMQDATNDFSVKLGGGGFGSVYEGGLPDA